MSAELYRDSRSQRPLLQGLKDQVPDLSNSQAAIPERRCALVTTLGGCIGHQFAITRRLHQLTEGMEAVTRLDTAIHRALPLAIMESWSSDKTLVPAQLRVAALVMEPDQDRRFREVITSGFVGRALVIGQAVQWPGNEPEHRGMMVDDSGLRPLHPRVVQDPQQRSQVEAITQSHHAFAVLPPLPGTAGEAERTPMPPLTSSLHEYATTGPCPLLLDAG